jgi:hypothetical protein
MDFYMFVILLLYLNGLLIVSFEWLEIDLNDITLMTWKCPNLKSYCDIY